MDYVKKYGELIKDKAGVKPERARSMIRLGLRAENARTKLLPNKRDAEGLSYADPSGDGKCVKGSGSSGEPVGRIFLPRWRLCSALVCSVCPWSVCHHLCPVLK